MIKVWFMRNSKNPNKICWSNRAIFTKEFNTIEEIVRYLKHAHKSVNIFNSTLNGQQMQSLYQKLEVAVPEYKSFGEIYYDYMRRSKYETMA